MTYTMTTKELIDACNIAQHCEYDFEHGKIAWENKLIIRNLAEGVTVDEIASRKQEIISYFEAQRETEAKAERERQAKIDAIPGLAELRAAKADLKEWEEEFEASFEGDEATGGLGVRPRPQADIEAMEAQYPIAAAYLKAEAEANKSHFRFAAIGQKALDAIINNPENYAPIITTMEDEKKAAAYGYNN